MRRKCEYKRGYERKPVMDRVNKSRAIRDAEREKRARLTEEIKREFGVAGDVRGVQRWRELGGW